MTAYSYTLMIGVYSCLVTHKKIKNLYLRINQSHGTISLSVPWNYDRRRVEEFAYSKKAWIKKQLETSSQRSSTAYKYISGEEHSFLGKKYPLEVITYDGAPRINFDKSSLKMYIFQEASATIRQKVIETWYRRQLEELAHPLIKHYQQLMRVKVKNFKIKKMRSRWGSCNVNTKNISLNLELARLPLKCLEYVVIHELAHLLEPSHNQIFWTTVSRFMPEYHLWRKALKQSSLLY
ncbi:MAG: M48 family metallopeptidase [Chlamydiota bacterium]